MISITGWISLIQSPLQFKPKRSKIPFTLTPLVKASLFIADMPVLVDKSTIFPATVRKRSFASGLWSFPLFFFFASTCFSNPIENTSAETLYSKGKYKESAKAFREQFSENPDDSRIAYNLANSNYKSGDFENALNAYNQASSLSSDKALQQRSLYNSGNAMFRMGKLEEAEKLYRKALELDSTDMDSKYNLEYVREQIKKKKQEEKKKQSQQKKDENSSSNSQPQNENGEGEKDKEKNQNNKPNPGDQKNSPKEQKSNPSQQKPEPKNSNQVREAKMSKEEAERRLNALNENRKDFIKKQLAERKAVEPMVRDW